MGEEGKNIETTVDYKNNIERDIYYYISSGFLSSPTHVAMMEIVVDV